MAAPALVQSESATGTSDTSLTVTLTGPTTAGNCLIVCAGMEDTTDNPSVSGITLGDSAGNFAAANTAYNNAHINAAIWVCPNCAGGQTSVVISMTGGSGGSPHTAAWVMEWSGIALTAATDMAPAGQEGGGSTWTSGSTGTLSQASEVVVGVVAAYTDGTLSTPGSPWNELTQATSGQLILGTGYQVVSSATALTYNGTLVVGDGYGYGTCIASFRAVSAVTHQGTAALSGSGSLAPAAGAFGGAAALSGSGTIQTPRTNWMINALSGSGTLSGSGQTGAAAVLSGSGTLGLARTVGWQGMAALSGSGTLAVNYQQVPLSGTGTLSVSGVRLSYPLAMSGTGTLSVLQVLGGLVSASPGASTPYAHPGTSQVAVAPPGTTAWQYLGSLGTVTALTYSFACPGGADKMSATVMVPAAYRTQLFNPGWQVRITRGGHQVWDGKLDEPVPTASGWNLTAVGTGNRGSDFLAVYSDTWPTGQPDESINGAISRGLPWVNPGIGTPPGAWFGQAVDSGAQTITALLNLICTRGGMTWYVNSQPGGMPGDDLSVFPLPAVPNRLLVCTTPVARTLGGDINTIWIRYQISADTTSGTTSVPATYGITVAQNAQSVAAHGVMETYIDLSDVGVQTAAAAQAVGNQVLAIYQRASWAGPFTGSYGQLLNTGGVPIDPGTDQAGTYMRLILTDYGYGGEVTPQFPVQFLTGAYEWDDFAGMFTVTPYVNVDQSLTGLLSLANTELTPIAAAGP